MPKSQDRLVNRLSRQVGDKGMAIAILKKRGDLVQKGPHIALTAHGATRAAMTPAQRAKTRAAKKSAHPPAAFTYSPKTNRATLKGKKG
jgi:hypothetical protein